MEIRTILQKEFKVLGRSKKLRTISDFLFLLVIAIGLIYYTNYSINKLNIKPIILNTISQIQNQGQETTIGEKKCSAPIVNAFAYYYNKFGDQIGIGPNPPIVNIPTNYWIFFEIKNQNDDLKDFSVSANLAENIILTGKEDISNGYLNYTKTNKQIIWKSNTIAKNSINRFGFEISLMPEQKDSGKILNLIENIGFVATDTYCFKEVSSTIPALDTKLIYDKFGKNNGLISTIK